MSEYLTSTQSVCAVCRRPVPARVWIEVDGVWFHKHCPEHGPQRARVSSDPAGYLQLGAYHRAGVVPQAHATSARGCPESCGLCPEHEQHVCLPIVEITDHCNLRCPICLVHTPGRFHRTRAEVARMLDRLIEAEGQIDVLNLSGGEPTVHPQFRDLVEECLSRREIVRVSVSTNGLLLDREPALLEYLAERRVIVSLQFDGLNDEIYQRLRGQPLLALKRRIVDACARLDAPMSLTATVARGVNEDQIASIAQLLFERPHVLSVMFQPAAYAGRAAQLGRPPDALTLPDIVARLDGAAGGAVARGDFSPLPCGHPACFALAFYLRVEAGRFTPVKRLVAPDRYLELIQNRALFGTDAESFRRVTDAVYDLWAAPTAASAGGGCDCACSPFLSDRALQSIKSLIAASSAGGYSPRRAMQVAERAVKSIFIHGFMDPETFDLSRARKCCQVYPQPDGRLLPVCVRNCVQGMEP